MDTGYDGSAGDEVKSAAGRERDEDTGAGQSNLLKNMMNLLTKEGESFEQDEEQHQSLS